MTWEIIYHTEFNAWFEEQCESLQDEMLKVIGLLGGNKAGDKNWYERNIPIAEQRFQEYLKMLQKNSE